MAAHEMYRGDKQSVPIFIALASAPSVGTDLTGMTIIFTAKNLETDLDASAVFQKKSSSATQITVANQTTSPGVATANILPGDTSSLAPGKVLYYDVQLTDGAGNPYTVDKGTITIIGDISISTS